MHSAKRIEPLGKRGSDVLALERREPSAIVIGAVKRAHRRKISRQPGRIGQHLVLIGQFQERNEGPLCVGFIRSESTVRLRRCGSPPPHACNLTATS